MPDATLILDIHTVFGPVPPRGVAEAGTVRLQSLLARHGVAGAVTLSTRGLYHSAAAGNRETAALCQEAGGALQPAAVLDPRQPNAAQSLSGARMICVMACTQAWPVRYAPLVNELKTLAGAGTRVPLFWEASCLGDATAAVELLGASGYAGPVVFGSVNAETLSEAVTVAASDERLFVATNGLRGVGEVAYAVSALGASRVVFGSGAPAARTMGGALGLVRVAGLSDADADLVLGGNAKRLLAAGGVAQ